MIQTAFGPAEATPIVELAAQLLTGANEPPIKNLVASGGDQTIGYVAFSPVRFAETMGPRGWLLAPLAVRPGFQKRGIGKTLVCDGLARLTDAGGDVVLVYGDPAYYARFGFDQGLGRLFEPPHPLSQPHGWQALLLGRAIAPSSPIGFTCVAALNEPSLW